LLSTTENLHGIASKILLFIVNSIKHRNCFICQQASVELICNYCTKDTILPLFPSPGHNLLEHQGIYKNLVEPSYEALYALGTYSGIMTGLINKLKFGSQPLAAEVLAQFFQQYLQARLEMSQAIPDILIPVPLSRTRYISRQYNQARLLSQALGKRFDIPVFDALKRTKHTKQQSSLDRDERLINIQSAFTLDAQIRVESIAVVDDVVTTGATINEAC
jgi:ComF family protein